MDMDGILQWLMNQFGTGTSAGNPASGVAGGAVPAANPVAPDPSVPSMPASQNVATQPIQNPAMAVTPQVGQTTPQAPAPGAPGATPQQPNKQSAFSNLTSNGLALMKQGAPMQMGGGGGGVHAGQPVNLMQMLFGNRNNLNQY